MVFQATCALWREIVGNELIIPDVNSDVVYLPELHFQQSDQISAMANPHLPETIAATVKSVTMGFQEDGYPMVTVVLAPQLEEGGAGGHNHQQLVEGIQRQNFEFYYKELGEKGGPCQLKKLASSKFFPNCPQKVFITFSDGSEYGFSFNNGRLSGAEWNSFIEAKHMELGDSLVFMKRREGDEAVFLGLLRAAAVRISGQSVLDAVQLAELGSEFCVRLFPHGGWPPVLIFNN